MSGPTALSRIAPRIAANLVAVAAVSAIFGLKVQIDSGERRAEAERLAARQAAIAAYDPYFTEQP
ncbi:MAG: hypothetical protein HXY23_10640 [Parvularculaceae bacterium]|jgi:hypothetical protein|nr:hypothetical protein [Parvularculaceae bacterium]